MLTDEMIRIGGPSRSSSTVKPSAVAPIAQETAAPAQRPAAASTGVDGEGNKIVRVVLGRTFAELERDVVMATFDYCGGSVPKASKVLKMSPSTLYRKREDWTRDDQ